MKVYPKAQSVRNELNLRQGIKSSVPNSKQLIAGIYTLYKIGTSNTEEYTEEYTEGDSSKIRLKNPLGPKIIDFYQAQLTNSAIDEVDFLNQINQSPLFNSLVEHLQVAIQLIWRLAEIDFVVDRSGASERTGGNRYNRKLVFSTNLDIIDNVLIDETGIVNEETKNLLFYYLTSQELTINSVTESKLVKTITVFSEENTI